MATTSYLGLTTLALSDQVVADIPAITTDLGIIDTWASTTETTLTAVALAQGASVSPTLFGAIGWTVEPAGSAAVIKPASGVLMLAYVRATSTTTVGHIGYQVTTPGATLTAGDSFIGLYDTGQTTPGSATRLGLSASQSTLWASTGYQNTALTAAATVVTGQAYLVAWLSVGTTPPTFAANSILALVNLNLTGATLRFATYGSALTALPTSFLLASMAALNASPVGVLLP